MKLDSFKPLAGYLVTRQTEQENISASGIIANENTDDFLVVGTVVKSAVDMYPVGCKVVYHVLDTQSFRDLGDSFTLLKAEAVLGEYAD